ncbi:DUF1501 domain-containing protein [Lentisphaera profundi]|uniref:DUF1501 domain-containing protein n=1 Tax=Lentisphaera profundi TaxID=1658616 RepID=A0ABY7VQV3_9BACT|nr:DUF1501 domain-containing protein [Lentisphaera profundi]WDE95699.1 DUF1501 domain-containing protein [Lentisphaera profundi]
MNPFSRRELIRQASMGFGGLALGSILNSESQAASKLKPVDMGPLAPKPGHHRAKAKSVIFLYMDGGVSQVDSFDPKPLLNKLNGTKPKFKVDATVFNNNGNILASPWDFKNYGKSGLPISDLFPHIGSCADDLCVIRSMTAFSPNHPNANYALHSGHPLVGRPSMGAWSSYGLGTLNNNLPSFVVLHGGQVPSGGMMTNFGSGFLPANHSASIFGKKNPAMRNTKPFEADPLLQSQKLRQSAAMDNDLLARMGHAKEVESSIRNYELAYRMQMEVPEVMDISGETEATKQLYGLDSPFVKTRDYGKQCLTARRLVERGVRFVELTISRGDARWDQHGNLKEDHEKNAFMVDQPIAGLIKDLKSRGLLDETLLVFTGEFGRTPFAQGTNGRDHNPQGFSMWMAGGGVKGGTTYGSTDEFGYRAIENKMTVHDLHANMLHLLGIDHERLTFRFSGRDVRLTDVHGEIIPEIMA